MTHLRPYQLDLVNRLRSAIRSGHRRVMLCAPTGAGKTVMFGYMISRHLDRGGRAVVFTHREELLRQTGGVFDNYEPIRSNTKPDLSAPLHIGMVETVSRRLSRPEWSEWLTSRSMVVIDEAHLSIFDKVFPWLSDDTIVIGASATPYRRGKKLPELSTFYHSIAQGVDTPDLIEQGYLAPARTYGIDIDLSGVKLRGGEFDLSGVYEENRTYEGVVKNWKRHTPGTKTLLFAANVDASKRVCQEFCENGIEAKHIDGNTSAAEREAALEWFASTDDAVLCNCGILTAGFDQPDIKTIILYRATTSLPLFLQMCGRGSRTAPGKTHFTILDFGNNIRRLGHWERPRTWSLQNDTRRVSRNDAAPVRICPSCDAMNFAGASVCVGCGYEFPRNKQEGSEEVDLSELAYNGAVLPDELDKPTSEMNVLELIERARHGSVETGRPYRVGWIVSQLRGRPTFERDLWTLAKVKGYKKGWVFMQKRLHGR